MINKTFRCSTRVSNGPLCTLWTLSAINHVSTTNIHVVAVIYTGSATAPRMLLTSLNFFPFAPPAVGLAVEESLSCAVSFIVYCESLLRNYDPLPTLRDTPLGLTFWVNHWVAVDNHSFPLLSLSVWSHHSLITDLSWLQNPSVHVTVEFLGLFPCPYISSYSTTPYRTHKLKSGIKKPICCLVYWINAICNI